METRRGPAGFAILVSAIADTRTKGQDARRQGSPRRTDILLKFWRVIIYTACKICPYWSDIHCNLHVTTIRAFGQVAFTLKLPFTAEEAEKVEAAEILLDGINRIERISPK